MNVTASALFWMMKDAHMLESPCWEIPSRCLVSPLLATDFRNLHKAPRGWNSTLGRLLTRYWLGKTLPTTYYGGNQKRWSAYQKTWSADQFPPLVSTFFCNKGKREKRQCIFNICVHDHSPRLCTSSRECGPRSSGHQSPISMHDGRGIELHDSMWNECTHKHNNA